MVIYGWLNKADSIVDKFPTTVVVDMFPSTYVSNFIVTTHVESVCLLCKQTAI